jgi:hypothetical protein
MPLALRAALASFALALAAVACGASNDRNVKLGQGANTCLDIDSDCTDSSQCCTSFCANRICVKREK